MERLLLRKKKKTDSKPVSSSDFYYKTIKPIKVKENKLSIKAYEVCNNHKTGNKPDT